MDRNKKKRNSILKKPPGNEDDDTVDVTLKIKRRISFSGKKSVKEFIAGEEEATIWGTSYEESAECLQSNSAESGLVNVNEKRIVLRNRRVIVQPNSGAKRRSKTKVRVAENDKENIFVHQPEVVQQIEVKPIIQLEHPKQLQVVNELESAHKSELDVVNENTQRALDRVNICSSTFDFINYSGLTSKSISIEQSVDVTLTKDELQMFKFRIPVTATDVSPNWSVSSLSDGSSPNMFSRSILMTEEDLKMLNMMRDKNGGLGLKTTQLTEIGSDEKGTIGNRTVNPQVDMDIDRTRDAILMNLTETVENEAEEKKRATMHINQRMSVSQCEVPEDVAKRAKRKTLIKVVDMEANHVTNGRCYLLEDGMNIVRPHEREAGGKKRVTMHINQTMNVSNCGGPEVEGLKRKTVATSMVMDDDSLRISGAHLNTADANSVDTNSPLRKKPMHNATGKSMDITNITLASICQGEPIRSQTIYFRSDSIEESLICKPVDESLENVVNVSVEHIDESYPGEVDEMELSTHAAAESDLNNSASPSVRLNNSPSSSRSHLTEGRQTDFTPNKTKKRLSIHSPADMIEDSPKAIRASQAECEGYCPKAIKSYHGISTPSVNHQTALFSVDVVDKAAQRVQHIGGKQRASIYTPIDIIEDSPSQKASNAAHKSKVPNHETIVTEAGVAEDVWNAQRQSELASPFKIKTKQQQLACAPTDTIESSSEPSKTSVLSRQTIYTPVDIMKEAAIPIQPELLASKVSGKKRESVYSAVDIIVDPPKSTNPAEATKPNDGLRSTVLGPRHRGKQRYSVYTTSDIIEDSPKVMKPTTLHKYNALQRQSVYTSSKIIVSPAKTAKLTQLQQETERPLTQSTVSASKVLVKHLTLKQDLIPDQVVLTQQKNPQSKMEPQGKAKRDESFMDMSAVQELSMSSIGMNFHQLNEELFRRETKATADERKKSSNQSSRQTFLFNNEIDLDVTTSLPPEPAASQTQRKTIHFDRGIENVDESKSLSQEDSMSKLPAISYQSGRQASQNSAVTQKNRQTIYFNQNNELDETNMDKVKPSIISTEKQVSNDNSTMDLSMKEVHHASKLSLGQSKLGHAYDQNLEESSSVTDFLTSQDATRNQSHRSDGKLDQSKRQTIPDPNALDVGELNKESLTGPKRRTIYSNEDMDLDEENSVNPSVSGQVEKPHGAEVERVEEKQVQPQTSNASYRRTIHFNQNLEVDDTNQVPPYSLKPQTGTTSKRRTLHFNKDIELEEEGAREMTLKSVSSETKRNTANNALRHGIYEEPKFVAQSNRQTIYLHQINDLEESGQASQEDPPKVLPRPKRLTILDNKPVDLDESPQKFSARKSSFSRTLNFNHMPAVTSQVDCQAEDTYAREEEAVKAKITRHSTFIEDSSPLYYLNAKSKSESTADIDRSLAEYLKVEAAGSEFRRNSQDMSIEEAEVGKKCDTNDGIVAEQQTKSMRQALYGPANVFEESGMQPLQPPATRRPTIFESEVVVEEPTDQRQRMSEISKHTCQSDIGEGNTVVRDKAQGLAETRLNIKANRINLQLFDAESNQKSFGAKEMLEETRADLQSCPRNTPACKSLCRGMLPITRDPSNVLEETRVDMQQNRSHQQISDTLRHTYIERKQTKRKTLMEPEPMMMECENSVITSPFLEKFNKSDEHLPKVNRKTIHFTNENAVDESFFDENLSKPATSLQLESHQTLYFNDSKNLSSDMEVTLAVNGVQSRSATKSKAAQSMKEILLENKMLFSQSKLPMPTTIDYKRSSIFFKGKDNSMDITTADENMDCDSPKGKIDTECTPARCRLSKSRIPQLIDGTQKLSSIKKSMSFLQRELPNLGSHSQREEVKTSQIYETYNADESIGTPREKQESFSNVEAGALETRQLQESFDTVESPRRLTPHSPMQLQESFETVEIPRRVTSYNPRQLRESFDTVEIPRRGTTFQKNDTLYMCPNGDEVAETTNMSQMSLFKFEDAPITISDVSTFFGQKQIPTGEQINETHLRNTTMALCNLDVDRLTEDAQLPKSSDSEDTAYNFDKFKKRYIELTCDSIMLSGSGQDIEKTHLSLVNTLDDESECQSEKREQSHVIAGEPESNVAMETFKAAIDTPKVAVKMPRSQEHLKPISSVCRKCQRHRLNETDDETTIGSFMLEPLPIYNMNLAALKELASKPNISDVAKVWRQKMRESDSFNISDESHGNASDASDVVDEFIASLDKERLVAAQKRSRKQIKVETSFVHTVLTKMQSKKSNWILNELLIASGILKFTHKRLRTFVIFISFTPKDPRGIQVNFNDIQLVPNVLHTRQWKPLEHALHYQLLVELPFDLRQICPSSEQLFQMLDRVEEVTQDVLKTGKDMWYQVLTSPASLIRDPSGRLYIQKFAQTKTLQNEVKCTEFQIEVRNMKNLSYESITMPSLYEFDEKIQMLPVGQNFLRTFLADPMRYIKA